MDCGTCGVPFSTTISNKQYCGNDICEKTRCYTNNKKSDQKRAGKREKYSSLFYANNKEEILKKKKEGYRAGKDYEVKEGWSTVRVPYSKVVEALTEDGYTLRKGAYINTHTKLDVICPKGHDWGVSYHAFSSSGHRCKTCMSSYTVSKPESEIYTHFKEKYQHLVIETSDRTVLKGKELDLYFPLEKVAVEYCGLYWHGESFSGRDKRYHRDKLDKCSTQNIRLITVFEDEYINRPQVVISRITAALGMVTRKIFARKCTVRDVSSKCAAQFMDKYHLQGKCGTLKRLGLFYEDRLVQVLTMGSLTRKHAAAGRRVVELKRLANVPEVSVIGGASRLFKAAKIWAKEEGYSSIKSYCDLRWAKGERTVYDVLGFVVLSETKYTPHYTKGQKRYRNFSLRKTPEERLTGKTEWELRQEQGYDRIWDCGHRTYVLELKD